MVSATSTFFSALKSARRARPRLNPGRFIDSLKLTVRGGSGGNGIPKYGGTGGQGGCVYFIATENASLRQIKQRLPDKFMAANGGEDSTKYNLLGRRGADAKLEVPVGIRVLDDKGNVLGDLNQVNDKCIAASGGIGGNSGTRYLGRPGETRVVNLDLRLVADVGLVGFPNAGKSTFLKAISRAKPRIATFPFTTMCPQVGMVSYPDLRSIAIADLPGIIEGAHKNMGLGHEFLKHIERTRLLVFVVDIFGFQLNPKHPTRSCLENIYALNKELQMYDPSLLRKPSLLLINKMDLDGSANEIERIKPAIHNLEIGLEQCPKELRPTQVLHFDRVLAISAKNSAGILEVKETIRSILDENAAEESNSEEKLKRQLFKEVGERGPKVF